MNRKYSKKLNDSGKIKEYLFKDYTIDTAPETQYTVLSLSPDELAKLYNMYML